MADQNEGIVGVVGTRADGCEVVCTLPETSIGERAAMIRREILPYVRSCTRIADGFQLEFPRDPQIRRNLEHWAELEEICCLEARFEISEHKGGLRLTVNGVDPAGNGLAELFELGRRSRPPWDHWIARITAAGGVGAVGAFLLLCVLPMGLIAVAGASVAGPLTRLESPPALAAGTLVIGGGWWWWRRRNRESAQRGSDC